MQTLPTELQELLDRQKIYHVLTSYCRALDRCDVDLMKSVYWETALMTTAYSRAMRRPSPSSSSARYRAGSR
jgi:hypothetical protein